MPVQGQELSGSPDMIGNQGARVRRPRVAGAGESQQLEAAPVNDYARCCRCLNDSLSTTFDLGVAL